MKIEIDTKKFWKAPVPIDCCPFCSNKLDQEYFMGIQTYVFDCSYCQAWDENKGMISKYSVRFHWGEHVGQDHFWYQDVVYGDDDSIDSIVSVEWIVPRQASEN